MDKIWKEGGSVRSGRKKKAPKAAAKSTEKKTEKPKTKAVRKSKTGTSRSKAKKDGDISVMSVETVEAPSGLDKKKKKDPWIGEDAAKRIVADGLLNLETISTGFANLGNPKPIDCDRFTANAAKNRQPEFPISNEKIIKLAGSPDVFISAARVTVPEFKRNVVIAQLPDSAANVEDFWKMIFQEEILSMVLFQAPQENLLAIEQILPVASGSFAQHGKMFLNNRKSDTSLSNVNMYTIEVLPDGCSNSTLVSVYHVANWKQKKALDGTAGQPVCDLVSTLDKMIKTNENASFVSVNGIGRAGTALTIFCMMAQILKETKDQKSLNVKETLEKLRAERSGLVDNLEQYQMIHKCLAFWFKSKASNEDLLKKVNEYAPNIQ